MEKNKEIKEQFETADFFVLLVDVEDKYNNEEAKRLFGGVYSTHDIAVEASDYKMNNGHYGHTVVRSYILPQKLDEDYRK